MGGTITMTGEEYDAMHNKDTAMTPEIEKKRRELFEAWEDAGILSRCGEEYENPYVESAWSGFNAALDAVEIELPPGTPRSEKIRQDRNRAIDDCRAAINATGLGIKVR